MKKWSEFLSLRERCWPGYKSVPGKKAYSPGSCVKEDLRQWFDKDHPKGGWKRINSKGEAIGPCAREPGEPKPKCMSNEKRAKLSKKERASAVASKRKHDPNPERKGEPINVSNFGKGKISEDMENLDEKNVPTSPEKWAQAKAQAKAKFDVYPSAYANGWAAKKYKEMGGGWKSVSEAVKDKYDEGEYDQEGDMAKSDLRSIIANAKKMHDMIKDDDNLPEWVQSKITKAEDYISTVANYMAAEMSEETKLQESGGPVLYKKGDDHIEKYGEDSFALYKDGKKAKYYTSLEAAKEAMNEEMENLEEKNVPTNPELWSRAKSLARSKFDVYPSAYANGWASKWYKGKGGGWRSVSEETKPPFEGPYTKVKGTITDKSGAKHTPMSRVRDIARMAMQKQVEKMKKPVKEEASMKAKIVKDVMKKKKEKVSDETFQKDPVISNTQVKM